MTAGSSRKTAGSRLAFFCPLFEKRRASFTVLPRNFSLFSDFYSSCSAREGLQPNVPGAPWVSFGLQSYLLFLGSTLLITSNPTPAVTACFALLGIAFSPSAFGRWRRDLCNLYWLCALRVTSSSGSSTRKSLFLQASSRRRFACNS